MAVHQQLLNLSDMELLRKVRLQPRSLVDGSFSGPHRSRYRGTAVEFADYREYVEGDDLRQLDWKVYARTDRYYIRRYEAERNLLTYLLVDTSGSMGFEGVQRQTDSKLWYGARLAAALAYIVVREGDEVGISLAGERLGEYLPARCSWPHLDAVVDSLQQAQAAGATQLDECLMQLYRRVTRRGVVAVISDFLDVSADFWKAVDLFRRSMFDVMLFHVVQPDEQELPDVDLARFVDPEGTGRLVVEPELVAAQYRRRFSRHLQVIHEAARTRGCDWFLARTDRHPYLFLKEALFVGT